MSAAIDEGKKDRDVLKSLKKGGGLREKEDVDKGRKKRDIKRGETKLGDVKKR